MTRVLWAAITIIAMLGARFSTSDPELSGWLFFAVVVLACISLPARWDPAMRWREKQERDALNFRRKRNEGRLDD